MVLKVWQEHLELVEKQLFQYFSYFSACFKKNQKIEYGGVTISNKESIKQGKGTGLRVPSLSSDSNVLEWMNSNESQWNHQNFEAGWYFKKKKKALSMLCATQYLDLSWAHSMPAHGHTALIRKHLGSTEPKVALWTHECLPCRRRTVRGPKRHGSTEVSTPRLGSQARVTDMDNFRSPSTQV